MNTHILTHTHRYTQTPNSALRNYVKIQVEEFESLICWDEDS